MNSLLKRSGLIYFLTSSRSNCLKVLCSRKCHALTSYGKSNINDVGTSIINLKKIGKMSTLSYQSSEHKPKDLTTEHILNMKSYDEVLNYLGRVDQNLLNENHVCSIMNHIFQLYYKDLWTKNTDLLENVNISYIQLILQNTLPEALNPLHEHTNFPILCKLLNDHVDTLEVGKAIEILNAIMYLNFSYEDSLFIKLFTKMMGDIDSMDLSHFISLSYILKALPGFHCSVSRKVINRLKLIVDSIEQPTTEEVQCIVLVFMNLIKLITTDTMKKTIIWLNNSIASINLNGNPDLINYLLKFIFVCYMNRSVSLSTCAETTRILENAACDNLHLFKHTQLQEMSRSIKCLKKCNDTWLRLLEDRANELFHDNLRLSEIISLMSTLTSSSSNDVINKYENAFVSSMSNRDEKLDILLLSNMADNLLDYQSKNIDLITLFQKHVAYNSQSIVAFISRFNKVAKVLVKNPFVDLEHEQMFVKELVRYLEGSHGMSLITTTCLGVYLLSLKDITQLPNHLYMKLFRSLNYWSMVSLTKLLNGLDCRMRDTRDQRYHIKELANRVQQIIGYKLIDSPSNTLYVLGSLRTPSDKNLNPFFLQNVIDNFNEISKNIDFVNLGKMLKFLNMSCHYIPDTFDNIVNYIIEYPTKDDMIISVLKNCAKANYTPKRMPEYLEILKVIYKRYFDEGKFRSCLAMLNYLSTFNIYPAKELKDFFNIDVIQDLEGLLENGVSHSKSLEDSLMFLNRSVVIESPELNIPWFHSHFKDPWLSKGLEFNKNNENFNGEVYSSLIDLFGSAKYIKRESLSPYFHKLDFECAIDSNKNKLLPASILNSQSFRDFRRVAICVQHENSFCMDSKWLTGPEFLKNRQLEKMNYKLIKIPHFEWYSMGLSEKASKVKYLKHKIFDAKDTL